MSKHTPGTWAVVGNRTKYVEARLISGLIQEVAACGPTMADEGYGQQQEANARLIAAAPDLLEALQNIADYWNQDQNEAAMADACWHAIHTARAAIAKATGEQP